MHGQLGPPNHERGLPFDTPQPLGFYCQYFPAKLLPRYRVDKVLILLRIAVGAAPAVYQAWWLAQRAGSDRGIFLSVALAPFPQRCAQSHLLRRA